MRGCEQGIGGEEEVETGGGGRRLKGPVGEVFVGVGVGVGEGEGADFRGGDGEDAG